MPLRVAESIVFRSPHKTYRAIPHWDSSCRIWMPGLVEESTRTERQHRWLDTAMLASASSKNRIWLGSVCVAVSTALNTSGDGFAMPSSCEAKAWSTYLTHGRTTTLLHCSRFVLVNRA